MNEQQFYQQHGYVLLPQLLSSQNIAGLNQSVMSIYSQWCSKNNHYTGFDQLVNMHSLTLPEYFAQQPESRVTFFQQLSCSVLVERLQLIFGSKLYFHNSQLFFNPVDVARKNYWHRDMQYSHIHEEHQQQVHHQLTSLHVRIPLIDETGIELIPHSHRQWDSVHERNVRFALNGHQQHDDLPASQLIHLKQGDVLVFNAQMIHRGRYDFNAARLALDICMGTAHPLIDGFRDRTVQPTAQELTQIENRQWFVEAAKL